MPDTNLCLPCAVWEVSQDCAARLQLHLLFVGYVKAPQFDTPWLSSHALLFMPLHWRPFTHAKVTWGHDLLKNRAESLTLHRNLLTGESVAGSLSLRVQQLDVRCETKTKDNVCSPAATLRYRASQNMVVTCHTASIWWTAVPARTHSDNGQGHMRRPCLGE